MFSTYCLGFHPKSILNEYPCYGDARTRVDNKFCDFFFCFDVDFAYLDVYKYTY